MDSYYKPNQIFRQKRVDKTRSQLSRRSSNESWMYDFDTSSSDILNKSINEQDYKIKSNYWRIPDNNLYLTSLAVNPDNHNQIAISSGSNDSNLFIYDFNDEELTHKQTITLPKITSMSWLDYGDEESALLAGHKNGMIHYVSVPNSSSQENARIVKRFNHKKHFTSSIIKDSTIVNLQTPKSWMRNQNNLISSCNFNIFLWDINHRSDLPILKNQHLGLLNFDISLSKIGVLGLVGDFGIALNDLRINENKPSIFTPSQDANVTGANNLKWAPYDSNILAASHLDNVVRLWDIRNQKHFGELRGHHEEITSLEWSEESSSDLYTASKDGRLIHWDLNFNEDLMNCTLNQGIESIVNLKDSGKFLTDEYEIFEMVKQRQCGTIISSSKASIVDLQSYNDKIISIDQDSYLGVHYKNGVDSLKVPSGYSTMMMDELLQDLPVSKEQSQTYEGCDDSSSIIFTPLTSPAKITNFNNDSNTSINSIESSIFDSPANSNFSGSPLSYTFGNDRKLNSYLSDESMNHIDEFNQIKAGFTYNEIRPLRQRSDPRRISFSAYQTATLQI